MGRRAALAFVALALVAGACGTDNKNDDAGSTSPSTTAGSAASSGSAACTSDTKMDVYSAPPHTDSPTYSGPLSPRDNPKYTVNPPSGGDHLSRSVGPGVIEGDPPPDGYLVHSLEHGYVVIWHKPGLADAQTKAIEAARDAYPRDVIVVERSDMEPKVAATAWGHRLLCDGADEDALTAFIKDFRNQAPEKIPH